MDQILEQKNEMDQIDDVCEIRGRFVVLNTNEWRESAERPAGGT